MNDVTWRKGSRCAANGTCVELGAWRTAHACAASNGCVEACRASGGVALIRDSVNPDGPRLALPGSQFRSLLTAIKDLP